MSEAPWPDEPGLDGERYFASLDPGGQGTCDPALLDRIFGELIRPLRPDR